MLRAPVDDVRYQVRVLRAASRRLSAVAAIVLSAAGLTACDSGNSRDAAVAAARSFLVSLEHQQGAQACRMLTSDARSAVVGATDATCAQAIVGVEERGSGVRGAQVWGDAAQVRIGGDVVFLRNTHGHWRVSAAGCTRASSGPYDCEVGG